LIFSSFLSIHITPL